jgi:hypothetical protein
LSHGSDNENNENIKIKGAGKGIKGKRQIEEI